MTMKVDWMRGCATALVTPFRADGGFDEERMRALVERQINGGVRLLVPCGTTGESATMSEAEDQRVIGLTVEVARGRPSARGGEGSARPDASQVGARGRRHAGQARRLRVGHDARGGRAVHRRGRLGRRLREAGS